MGTPTFNAPFSHDTARRLYSEESWDESDFRCLHLCFYPRSPRDAANVPGRPNTAENSYKVAARRIKNVFRRLAGKPIDSGNKHRFYRKGPLVTHNVESFRLRREYMDLVQDWPTVQAVLAKAPEL